MATESTAAPAARVSVSPEQALQRALIDRSTKLPVLFFITSGVSWLLAATILGLIASIKVHHPAFLDADWLYFLHYGRLQPAFWTTFIYGWAFQAGIAIMIWIMARLCAVPLRNPWTLIVAGHFWNVGVVLGVVGIFFGGNTSLEWLEFPAFVWPILLVAYALVSVWMVVMFRARRNREDVYISVWYLMGACVWFPWIFATANVFLRHFSGAGVIGASINAWYTSTLVLLFFVPVGLASLYYLVPKIAGRAIYNYQLAIIGFWSLAAFAGWTGVQKLMGGPLPIWMPAVGSAATVFLLIPFGTVALNHHSTVRGRHHLVESSPSLRFSFMGGIALTIWAGLAALFSFFPASRLTQFTLAAEGMSMLVLYGFFSMAMFGAIYFIVPRLVGCEWFSRRLIRQHFWFSVYGITAMVVILIGGGISQGESIEAWDRGAVGVVEISRSWLIPRTLAWLLIGYSNMMFLFHLTLMILRLGRRSSEPTLLRDRLIADAAAHSHAQPAGADA